MKVVLICFERSILNYFQDEEGMCTGKSFSETGLVGLLENAVQIFKNALMYELVNEVDKILIPVLEARRDFNKLQLLHKNLSEGYNKIIATVSYLNSLSVNPIKWSNTLKQFFGNLPANCLSVFDHFVELALKGSIATMILEETILD